MSIQRETLERYRDAAKETAVLWWGTFKRRAPHFAGMLAAILLFASWWVYYNVEQPPVLFPLEEVITIPEGSTITDAAYILKRHNVVHSVHAFRLAVAMAGTGGRVLAGDYYFTEPLTLTETAQRVTRGEFGLEPVRVTVPEGSTTYRMVELFERVLPKFDAGTFILLAEGKEGYLYPDTYFFLPNVTAADVLAELEGTFYENLRVLEEDIGAFGRPVHEIVTMASLLEKEAHDHEERQHIAGVLWHRIEIGMPLQVDAVFGFIARTDTFSPRFSHLEVDDPYNTYKHKGLPPGPIGSPSLSSLEAAVQPIETDALFYLHGRDGTLRMARTYDEHLTNRWRYLD